MANYRCCFCSGTVVEDVCQKCQFDFVFCMICKKAYGGTCQCPERSMAEEEEALEKREQRKLVASHGS